MTKRKVTGVSPLERDHKTSPPLMGGIQLQAHVRINKPPEICYQFWRDFENLPQVMSHLSSVEVLDEKHSHWVVTGPADTAAEWDAEIIEDIPDERISWRSLAGSQIDNAGSVQFAAMNGGEQTDVKVALTYNPPFGILGEMMGKLFGEGPDEQLMDDLVRFKEAVEKEA